MKKIKNEVVNVNNSNVTSVINEEVATRAKGKVKSNVDAIENTSLSIDEEESESPKKKATFDNILSLFGFSFFDRDKFFDEHLQKITSKELSYSEYKKRETKESKRINAENEKLDTLPFEMVCEKIVNSPYFSDFSLFVDSDLEKVKSLIYDGKKLTLFHGKVKKDEELNETWTPFVTEIKGLHKPYRDYINISFADYSVRNVVRAFRCYSYYKASLKRCYRMKKEESFAVQKYLEYKKILHEKYGYMPNDFENIENA